LDHFYTRDAMLARVGPISRHRVSVCPSVGSRQQHHVTDQDSNLLTPTVVGGRRPFPPLKFALKVTHRFSNNDFDQYPRIVPQQ